MDRKRLDSTPFTTGEMTCLTLFFFSHFLYIGFIYFSFYFFEIPARLSHSNVWRFQSGGTLAGSGFVCRHIWESYDTLDNMRHCYSKHGDHIPALDMSEKLKKFVAAWNFFPFLNPVSDAERNFFVPSICRGLCFFFYSKILLFFFFS